MKTRSNWLFVFSMAIVFASSAVMVTSAQDGRFFGNNGITVFTDKNFRGDTQTFQNEVRDLRSYGFDRKISSFRIGSGEVWQICDGANYSGRCASVSGEEFDLSNNGWNDRIRSFRRTNGSGGGGGWGGNGQTSTPPSWAQGTFYGTAPDGSQITLTITRNGQVTANISGSMSYGTYYRGNLNINGAQSNVSQWGNGIRTRRNDNGETINYSRNGWGNGGNNGGGGWNGGNNPISWAVGAFNARNPQTGGTIYLTINRNGQVTVNMDGNMTYGTLNGTTLTINGATATVQKNGNGIRTVRNDNGERISYRRN